MEKLHFGDVSVNRVVEIEAPGFHPSYFLPDSEQELIATEHNWLLPHFIDAETERMVQSVHSYLIQTEQLTILVDTCIGNDKNRPSTPPWSHLKTPWLKNLSALDVSPEDVDFVLCTHLHVDHIGWNTRLQNGRWIPTFPKAKYLFHRTEFEHWSNEQPSEGQAGSPDNSFQDSVLPIIESGQGLLIDSDFNFDDCLYIQPSPGHSPGHVCLHLNAGGKKAIFSGDVMHHPIQVAYPEWNSRFCWDETMSRNTRTKFISDNTDRDVTILTAHFPFPTAGKIVSNGNRSKFQI